jgi:23S rRNA pseudouridine2605 synthase
MRINRWLAMAGVASRRGADNLIANGEVKINGKRAVLGDVVGETDKVEVSGKSVNNFEKKVYYLLNKPAGILSTVTDDRGRETVVSLAGVKERVFPVGRLDQDTTGLLILTNDGELAYRMTHPKFGIEKTYEISYDGDVTLQQIEKLTNGVYLGDGKTRRAVVNRGSTGKLLITLKEGKKRQVRRMCEVVGIRLYQLKRIKMGKLNLGDLAEGETRELTAQEIADLVS